ncbi:MAG: diguanylate cyclase, partial [Alphaproteobacteria bacterium]|nr:diguanylate cyclase [Alphaproteobacteria bacterium]
HPAVHFDKWQNLIDLLVDIFEVESGNIVHLKANEFKTIISSQNDNNFLKVGMHWFDDSASLCQHVVENNQPLCVENIHDNPEWCDNLYVQKNKLGAYLGFPLKWPDQTMFGTICLIDRKPLKFDPKLVQVFEHFRDLIDSELRMIADYEKIRELAVTDELTGLHNLRGLMTLGSQKIKDARRMREKISVIYLDIDNLKQVNDTHGHKYGDLGIKMLAEILKANARESDIIARVGGDEFVAMLLTSDQKHLRNYSRNIEHQFTNIKKKHPELSSMGVSSGFRSYEPSKPITVDTMIKETDQLMYKNKLARKQHYS